MTHALLLALPLLACGGQKTAPEAAAASSSGSSSAAASSGTFPSDAASRAFLNALTTTTIRDFAAVDSEGAKVVLSTLQFRGDNSWSASGYVDGGEERMECTEKGTWTMDPATSPKEATITWVIGSTDCVGREGGTEVRAQLTVDGENVEIAFR